MLSTLHTILKKIRSRGFRWFFERLIREFRIPETPLGKFLHPIHTTLYKFFFIFDFCKKWSKTSDILYLFYDLEIAPITFDFTWALALADLHRKKLALKHLQVVFVPGSDNGLKTEIVDYEAAVDKEARYWRKYNLLFPLTHLLPSCRGLLSCTTREEAHFIQKNIAKNIYPTSYSTIFPIIHSIVEAAKERSSDLLALSATAQALRYIKEWIEPRALGRKVIVITLRQYHYMPKRNSNIEAWVHFAKKLDPKSYFAVIVPDTEVALHKPSTNLQQFEHFTEACWNIELRAALYEYAYLNLGINNGPFSLCWLNKKCRYLMFKVITEEVPQTSSETLKKYGFILGETPPFAQKHQKWIWRSDDAVIIEEEFQKMCKILDNL